MGVANGGNKTLVFGPLLRLRSQFSQSGLVGYGLSFMPVQRSTAGVEISGFLIPWMGQSPKTLDPTFPILQLSGAFC